MKVVVVSPHRDDAAFSLGLAVDQWLAAGHHVQIVNCFTRSEYAPFSDVNSLHPHDRASFASAVRRREDISWGKLLKGKFSIQDLDMLDAPMRLACDPEVVCTIEIRPGDRAVARIAGALQKFARAATTGEIAIAVPLAVGEHIDHRVVHQAALEVLKDAQVPFAFYEDLPYSARSGSEAAPQQKAAGCGLELQACFAATPAEDPEVSSARKQRIAECYDSQVDSEDVTRIAKFCQQYGGRERLWGNRAWLSSALSCNGYASA